MATSSVQAQLYWDTNGATAGAGGTSPSGIWDTSTSSWNDNSGGTTGTSKWSAGETAIFSAGTDATGAFTATIAANTNLSVAGITFEEGAVTIAPTNSTSILSLGSIGMTLNAVTGTHTINAVLDGSTKVLTKQGTGTVVLGANNSFGQLDLMGGKVTVSSDANLGLGSVRFFGGIVGVTSSFSASRRFSLESTSGGFDIIGASTTLTLTSGLAAGGSSVSFTKEGAGTLDLTVGSSRSGFTTINDGTLRLTSGSGLGSGGQVTVNAATLYLANVAVTQHPLVLNNGATLLGTGTSSYGNSGGSTTASVANGSSVNLKTAAASDLFNFITELRSGDATSLVTISGPGTIVFAKGTTGTTNAYKGSFAITEGTLRVTDRLALATTGVATGRPITISGGTLELRVDAASDFRSNISITGDAVIVSNRTTSGAGVTHNLGTLTIGNQELTLAAGSGATNGTQALTFGATTLSGNATFNVTDGANASMEATLGSVGENTAGRSVIKTGSGTLTLAGAGTFTGNTTINGGTLIAAAGSGGALESTAGVAVNSTGTLRLGANDQIKNSTPMTLAGGTFAKGDFSQGSTSAPGVGALTLTATGSRLDFGSGTVGVLSFADFVPGVNTLTIDNWTGNANTLGSAATDRLIFNTSQSSSDLSSFSFIGYEAGATQFDLGNGFYEITPVTPVPEPATYVAGILALLAVGYQRRRMLGSLLKRS